MTRRICGALLVSLLMICTCVVVDRLISLTSERGERLKGESTALSSLLVKRYTKQVNLKYCGPASLANIVNGINAGYRIKYRLGMSLNKIQFNNEHEIPILVDENDIVNYLKTKAWKHKDDLDVKGLTLSQMREAASLLGFGVHTTYTLGDGIEVSEKLKNVTEEPDTDYTKEISTFRKEARRTLEKVRTLDGSEVLLQTKGIIVNIELDRLDCEGEPAHFSPLAAYHEALDRFLLMDVWPKNPAVWVKTIDLWKAMTGSLDSDSNLPRGFLIIYELL